MNNFVFENSTKVYFGKGVVAEYLPEMAKKYGSKVLMGYGGGSIKENGVYDEVTGILKDADIEIVEFGGIMSNPTLDKMLEGAKLAKENQVDWVLAVGGGSVMDCCKAISLAANYDGDVWEDFWENQGVVDFETLPLGMIVTMPATGSEVNGGAVLTNTKKKIKTDRDYPALNAKFALMDPSYTFSMPMRQLKAGTFDILSHVMETYFSFPVEDNISDDISEALMRGLIRDMKIAIADPTDYNARSNIMWAASMAENRIIKMGKSKDFQVHNMEHQLSAFTNCNHGEGLAVLHPVYYRHIYKDGLGKFVRFAKNVWGLDPAKYPDEQTLALEGIRYLERFIWECGLPTRLRDLGIDGSISLREIAFSCYTSSGAFREIDKEEIYEIYRECF